MISKDKKKTLPDIRLSYGGLDRTSNAPKVKCSSSIETLGLVSPQKVGRRTNKKAAREATPAPSTPAQPTGAAVDGGDAAGSSLKPGNYPDLDKQSKILKALKKKTGQAENEKYFLRKKPRSNIKWTPKEVEALRKGVAKFGFEWSKILQANEGVFHPQRRIVDCSHKYDLLNNRSSFSRTEPQRWVFFLKDRRQLLDALGDPISVVTRFPSEAAEKASCFFKTLQVEIPNVLRVQSLEEPSRCYLYYFCLESGCLVKRRIFEKGVKRRPRLAPKKTRSP